MKLFLFLAVIGLVLSDSVNGSELVDFDITEESYLEANGIVSEANRTPHWVDLRLIQGAAAKGAVCLDGTLPGYHWDIGSGAGANSWVIHLEGALGWCHTDYSCAYIKKNKRGSSNYMEKRLGFAGILSNKAEENPDFFNWNRVKLRYCDGASLSGDGEDKAHQLEFRGQKIWLAAMDELMSKGMRNAHQALLSGCSSGGVASIIHCDEFRGLFPGSTKVKCLSDAGLFLDVKDVSGGQTIRNFYSKLVALQGVEANLPKTCTDHLDPTSCFFAQNLISSVKTPLFILSAAYDAWQVRASLLPPSADPKGEWTACSRNPANCSTSQIQFLRGFRNEMLDAVKDFSKSPQNGLYITSCFAHCQSDRQDTWFADDSLVINKKKIATAVGDWFFDRAAVKSIDCPYPCDKSCRNLIL